MCYPVQLNCISGNAKHVLYPGRGIVLGQYWSFSFGDTRSTPRPMPACRNRDCEEQRDQVPSRGCRHSLDINRSKKGASAAGV